jgi:HTH-type transcriptional regulator/antitoxin MqsA
MQNQNLICPMCEEGQLIPNVCTEQTRYKEKTLTVDYESSTCSTCGSEIVTPIQAQSNQARILDEQRKINGLLMSREIKRIRESFQLTLTEAANLFGEEALAFSKYEKGEAIQSATLDKLLRLVNEIPIAFERLRLISGMKVM